MWTVDGLTQHLPDQSVGYGYRLTHPTFIHGHFTTGGMEERIDSTLPPVLRPNTVPRS